MKRTKTRKKAVTADLARRRTCDRPERTAIVVVNNAPMSGQRSGARRTSMLIKLTSPGGRCSQVIGSALQWEKGAR